PDAGPAGHRARRARALRRARDRTARRWDRRRGGAAVRKRLAETGRRVAAPACGARRRRVRGALLPGGGQSIPAPPRPAVAPELVTDAPAGSTGGLCHGIAALIAPDHAVAAIVWRTEAVDEAVPILIDVVADTDAIDEEARVDGRVSHVEDA